MKKWAEKHSYDLMIAPLMVFLVLMVAFPLIYTVYLSFTNWNMGALAPKWLGLKNYIDVLTDSQFWSDTGHTLYLAFGSVAIELVLGTGIAIVLNRPFAGKNFIKTLFLLPMVATPIAVGMVWQLIYEPTLGVANYLLKFLGIEPVMWLIDTNMVMKSMIIIEVWEWTPMVMLIVLAGLAGMPQDVFEAAKVDGANRFQKIRHIDFPTIVPSMTTLLILRFASVMSVGFEKVYLMQDTVNYSVSNVISTYVYEVGLVGGQYSFSTAVGLFNSVVSFTLLVTANLIVRRFSDYSLW